MKKMIMALLLLFSYGAYAQELSVDRAPKSQEEFKTFISEKFTSFEKAKEDSKKLPKLKKEDLIEILSFVPFDDKEKFTISYIRKVDGIDKAALYDKIYQSLVDVFVNAKNVMQMQDKESGIIVCKGIVDGTLSFNMMGVKTGEESARFTLKIQVREGRYKIDIYDIETEKGDLMDNSSPIETFLMPDYYSTTFGQGAMKTKRTDAHYINVRTQVLLEQLYNLYQIEDDIYKNVAFNNSSKEDW